MLNAKQTLFAEEYLKDFNGTQAAIRAGYSKRSAASQAHDLLRKPDIREKIRACQDAAQAVGIISLIEAKLICSRIAQDSREKTLARLAAIDRLAKLSGWDKPEAGQTMVNHFYGTGKLTMGTAGTKETGKNKVEEEIR